jgi:hypothetical protein
LLRKQGNEMKELMDRWLGEGPKSLIPHMPTGLDYVEDLQAYIDGLWTEITDDPESWPSTDAEVMFSDWMAGWQVCNLTGVYGPDEIGTRWRPLIPGIDTPEQS